MNPLCTVPEGTYPRYEFYPDVKERLDEYDSKLEMLRSMWRSAMEDGSVCTLTEHKTRKPHAGGKCMADQLARDGQELADKRTDHQFRLNRHSDELIAESNLVLRADRGDFLVQDTKDETTPVTDADWLKRKTDWFIRKLARRVGNRLYIGTVVIGDRSDGFIHFRCYAGSCKFRARHYVGSNSKMAECIVAMVFAHTYKHGSMNRGQKSQTELSVWAHDQLKALSK